MKIMIIIINHLVILLTWTNLASESEETATNRTV